MDTATLVHLPVRACWLNQIEIVFSVIQHKVIRPADFADRDALAERLLAFEARYNTTGPRLLTGPSTEPTSSNCAAGSTATSPLDP